MARVYSYEYQGWSLGREGSQAIAVKGQGNDRQKHRLGLPRLPENAARAALKLWVDKLQAFSSDGNPTVREVFDANLVRLEREGKTTRTTATRYDRMTPFFGHVRVKDITNALCQDYVKAQAAEDYAGWTIFNDMHGLRAALKSAFETKMVDTPVERYVWAPSKPAGRDVSLTPNEFWAWHDAATSQHIRLFLLLYLLTAQRHTAIVELRWEHVDFERGVIDFAATMRKKTSMLDKGWQKNRAIVAIGDTLRAHLKAAQAVAKTPFVIEYQGKRVYNCQGGTSAARIAAGLPDYFVPHMLRHTAATWATAAGLDLGATAAMTGHKDMRVLETYIHKRDEEIAAASKPAVTAVNDKLGNRLRVVK